MIGAIGGMSRIPRLLLGNNRKKQTEGKDLKNNKKNHAYTTWGSWASRCICITFDNE